MSNLDARLQELLKEPVKSGTAAKRYAVAYVRVSTEMQEDKGLSMPAQRAIIEKYARDNEIDIVAVYEEAKSSYQDEHRRTEFAKMIAHTKADPRISVVLVHEFSRFCRDDRLKVTYETELEDHNVRVVSVSEPMLDRDTPAGMWLGKIIEAKNKSYSMEVAFHTRKGMAQNAQTRDPETGFCYKNGGAPPYGFESYHVQRGFEKGGLPAYKTLWRLDTRIVAGKPVHEWARHILELAANGISLDKIRNALDAAGVPSPRYGKTWGTSSVHSLLEFNVLLQFAGYGVWNVRGQKQRRNPRHEWVIVENAHPAITTLDEVLKVQEIREARSAYCPKDNQAMVRASGSRFLLTGGLFKCGRCGSNMVSHTDAKSRGLDYYVCNEVKYRKGKACGPGLYIDKTVIEDAVVKEIMGLFCDWSNLDAFTKAINDRLEKVSHTKDCESADIKRHLAEIERGLSNIRSAIESGYGDIQWANDRTMALSSEREKWEAKLAELKGQVMRPRIGVQDVKNLQAKFWDTLENGNNTEKREAVRMFVSHIRLEPENAQVLIGLKGLPAHLVYPLGAGRGFEPLTFGL